MKGSIYILSISTCLLFSCSPSQTIKEVNPPAEGFNLEQSDAKAIEIADQVMEAMGGREAWDNIEVLEWNFFGSRKHHWNKTENIDQIIGIKDTFEMKINLDDHSGMVNLKGVQLSSQDSLDKYLQKGLEAWINDSYWIVMPFKLKDSGVTLKYLGEFSLKDSTLVDQLSLTFERVGVTPENKYVVSVDRKSKLITQWDFFTNANDEAPRFTTPWADYKKYGDVLLASSRGEGYTIGDISVTMKE